MEHLRQENCDKKDIESHEEPMDDNVDKKNFSPPVNNSRELLRQPFLLDTDISVEQWLVMADLKIHDFVRFQVGDESDKS